MQDSIIIGSYASTKLLVTEFNIDRSSQRTIQSSYKRSVVGSFKQSVSITVSGYLQATSFDDLEAETDQLLAALNTKTLKLVLGSRPDRYWLVSWADSDLARKPGNGGYVLPISLTFDALEESAVIGLPTSTGYRKSGSMGITPTGEVFQSVKLAGARSLVYGVAPTTTATTLLDFNGHTASIVSSAGKAVLTYSVGGTSNTISTPLTSLVAVSIAYTPDAVQVSVGDVVARYAYTSNLEGYVLDKHASGVVRFGVALDFVPMPDYIKLGLAGATEDSVIKVADLLTTPTIQHTSNAPTPASLLVQGTNTSFGIGDFAFYQTGTSVVNLNSITSVVTSSVPTELGYGIGGKTLFPELKYGKNEVRNSSSSCTYALLAWRNRSY